MSVRDSFRPCKRRSVAKPATAPLAPPVAILVVAHAPLASALKSVAEHVFGEQAALLTAVDVLPGACAADSAGALVARLQALDQGSGVLVLTDLPGASPCNICVQACREARALGVGCELITGVNAAMVLRAISRRETGLAALSQCAIEGAAQALLRVD